MNRFFRYSGSKASKIYTSKVNIFTSRSQSNIYIEPFAGSGAILFNLKKKFDKYVVNDIDRNIVRIYKTFKIIDYSYYLEVVNDIFKTFGKFTIDVRYTNQLVIEQQKESYYNFREYFNKNHWKTDTILEGIYLHMLANSCINSFLRFSINGMNQGFGLRFYYLEKESFTHIKEILQKTTIYNLDYKIIFEKYPDELYFIDPPYFSQSSSYIGFNLEEYLILLSKIKELKEYIYTDIENEYNKDISKTKLFIRKMLTTAPNSYKKVNINENNEYLFTTFDDIQINLDSLF